MRKPFNTLIVIVSAIVVACSPPQETSAPPGAELVIRNVTVIDVETGNPLPDRTVWIGDGMVLSVAENDGDADAFEGRQIDGRGQFLIPGLWDLHVHAMSDPDDAIGRILPLFVAHGVTGVRDMGAVMSGLVATRERLAEDTTLVHPEIVAGGPLLDGQALPWYGDLPLVLTTPDEVASALADLAAAGVDFFKVYDGLSPEVYEAIVAEAANLDRLVAGHIPRAVGLAGVTSARQHTIEHMTPSTFAACVADPQSYFDRSLETRFSGNYDGYFQNLIDWFEEAQDSPACNAAITAMGEADMRLTATLVMEVFATDSIDRAALQYFPAGGREWCETNLQGIDSADAGLRDAAHDALFAFTARLRESGVTVLAGSDTPNFCNVPGPSLHWELERLVAAGLSPGDVLRLATREAAETAQRPAYGRIVAGAAASVVLLNENPLEDIGAVRAISHVIHDGQVHDRVALDAMLLAAAEAAGRPE